MKKLFISVPMRGRTEENIKKSMDKMHKIAEIIFDQKLERIESYIPGSAPEDTVNSRVWYLGESIKMMAQADYFIGVNYSRYSGCEVEREVASMYGIKSTLVNAVEVGPDIAELEKVECAPMVLLEDRL